MYQAKRVTIVFTFICDKDCVCPEIVPPFRKCSMFMVKNGVSKTIECCLGHAQQNDKGDLYVVITVPRNGIDVCHPLTLSLNLQSTSNLPFWLQWKKWIILNKEQKQYILLLVSYYKKQTFMYVIFKWNSTDCQWALDFEKSDLKLSDEF